MIIERLEVQGGFLDGLDLKFERGLNVLIGPRGAGKTSVLELIRFALGVPAMTDDAQVAADRQARAVLGDGTVSVSCSVQGRELILVRTSLDDAPSASVQLHTGPPLIVSQNEIEAIGLNPQSRKEMLDRMIRGEAKAEQVDSRRDVLRLQERIEKLRAERDVLTDRAEQLAQLPDLLAEAERAQAAAVANVESAAPLQKLVAEKADELGKVRSLGDAYRITEEALRRWHVDLSEVGLSQPLPALSDPVIEQKVSAAADAVATLIKKARDELEAAERVVAAARGAVRGSHDALQKELKAGTEELERLQQGAGEHGRRVSALRQQLGRT